MQNSQHYSIDEKQAGFSQKFPTLKIAFLNVGQGDATVISCPDTHEAVVVDCLDFRAVLSYLREEEITDLSAIVITHLHADHYAGVPALLDNYLQIPGMQECKVVAFNKGHLKKLRELMEDDDDDQHSSSMQAKDRRVTTIFQNLIEWHEQNDQRYTDIQARLESSIPFPSKGTLVKSLQLLHPHAAHITRLEVKGLNNTSVVLRVTGANASALLTGDLEPLGWQQLAERHPDLLHSDVLKFPHHGGTWKDEDVDNLLDTVNPSVVVISVGSEGIKYNHPNPSVFKALSKRPHIRVLCTQATNQCQELVLSQRESVLNLLQIQANSKGRKFIGTRRGCPCAGTIVIELNDQARVLQPDIQFHYDSIIKPHFRSHQCNLSPTLPIIQNEELQPITDS